MRSPAANLIVPSRLPAFPPSRHHDITTSRSLMSAYRHNKRIRLAQASAPQGSSADFDISSARAIHGGSTAGTPFNAATDLPPSSTEGSPSISSVDLGSEDRRRVYRTPIIPPTPSTSATAQPSSLPHDGRAIDHLFEHTTFEAYSADDTSPPKINPTGEAEDLLEQGAKRYLNSVSLAQPW